MSKITYIRVNTHLYIQKLMEVITRAIKEGTSLSNMTGLRFSPPLFCLLVVNNSEMVGIKMLCEISTFAQNNGH